ncbi:MAG: hypothetical protein ACI4EX_01845 [Lachnospiraceae bacterium]
MANYDASIRVGTEVDNSEIKKTQKEIERLSAQLDRVREKSNKVVELGGSEKQLESLGYDAEILEEKLAAATNKLEALQSSASTKSLSLGFKKANDSGKKFFDTVAKGSKKSSGLLGSMSLILKAIALRLFVFKLILKAFNAMVSAMKEGFKNLAQYSSDYNSAMSALKSESAQLKNGLAAAFEPIVTTIIPYITQLVAWLNKATDTFARFLAALQGKQTYTRAKKQVIDYAKSLQTAKSAAQGVLAAFDSINVLSKSESGGASAGGEVTGGGAFEEAEVGADMQAGVQALMDKLAPFKEMIDQWMQELDLGPMVTAFNNLKTACEPFAGYLYNGLLWFLQNILLPLSKWTIEEGLPSFLNMVAKGVGLLSKAIETAKPSLDYIWEHVLKPMAEFTGDTFVWAMGEISDTFTDLSDLFEEKGEEINNILDAVGKAMEFLWIFYAKPTLQFLQGGIGTAFDYIVNIVGDIIDVLSGVIDFISGVFTLDWEKAWNGIVDIFKGIINFIIDIYEGVVNTIISGLNMISIDVPEWVPGIGGKHFGFNLEKLNIPRLATGGITNGPTTALIGEAGKEAVLPLENNTEWMDTFAEKIGDRPINIRFTGNLAELGRLLKPVLDAENSRIGRNLRIT